jgi:hypothetical protein
MVGDELFLVSKFWQQDAPESWSFNDVIRECARPVAQPSRRQTRGA